MALTVKQEKFIQNIVKGMSQKQEDKEVIAECIKIFIDNSADKNKQYASSILLKMILKSNYRYTMNEIKEFLGFKINDRNSSKIKLWNKKIKKIGHCEICGSRNNLIAHHIIPWEHSINGRADLTNGKCLCNECHRMIHNDFDWIKYMRLTYGK